MNRFLLITVFWILALPATGMASIACERSDTATDKNSLHSAEATALEYQFESGAMWTLCWHIDNNAGLVLSDVYYGAPGDVPQKILDAASLSQVLFKYDEDTNSSHLVSEFGFGGASFIDVESQSCTSGTWLQGIHDHQICQRVRQINPMTKVRRHHSIQRHEMSLHSWSQIGAHRFQLIWRLTEDGEIKPQLILSGKITRYTDNSNYGVRLGDSSLYASTATLLTNWRLDFNINGTALNDHVDEIEFIPSNGDALTRSIVVKQLMKESIRQTNNETFRGWRISDAEHSSGELSGTSQTRIGYYLDPQPAGFRVINSNEPWTAGDFAVTVRRTCEKFASNNRHDDEECADSLDGFIGAETLDAADTVVWFSVSRHFTPRLEDLPAISSVKLGFSLIPFDWSAYSPFSPPEEGEPDALTSAGQP